VKPCDISLLGWGASFPRLLVSSPSHRCFQMDGQCGRLTHVRVLACDE
jgi:hypothetical protein